MPALTLDALEAVIEALCPYCTPRHLLADVACLGANCVASCQGRDDEQRRVRALAALCRACKQARPAATRHLYHRPTATRWPLLARTLLARPDLARRVRHLCARDWTHVDSAVRDPSFPAEVAAYWGEKAGNPVDVGGEAALDVVVTLCPELEEVDAVLEGWDAFSLSEPGSLPELATVAVAHHDTEGGLCLSELGGLARAAPNVRALVGWQVASCYDETRLEALTRLRLGSSGMLASCLRNALRSCPRIEDFAYRAGAAVGQHQFTPREAEEALVELAPKLKNLVLNLDDVESPEILMARDWVLRSLKGLGQLRKLEVDTRCLVPHKNPTSTLHRRMPDGRLVPMEPPIPEVIDGALVELLPESTRELRIVRGDHGPRAEKLGAALVKLAAEAGQFPGLRAVLVQGAWDGAEDVRRVFEEKGVTFVTFERADFVLAPAG